MGTSPAHAAAWPSPEPGPLTEIATPGFCWAKASAARLVIGSTVDDPVMVRLPLRSSIEPEAVVSVPPAVVSEPAAVVSTPSSVVVVSSPAELSSSLSPHAAARSDAANRRARTRKGVRAVKCCLMAGTLGSAAGRNLECR